MDNINRIIDKLESVEKIAIFGHSNPDGDCIGSMLGLGTLLEKKGKDVFYFVPGSVSRVFDFLDGKEKIKSGFDFGKYDVLVFLDFSGYRRMDEITSLDLKYFDNHDILVIDHHLGNETPSHAVVYKDASVMSTCELIFEITNDRWKDLYDDKIATYLYIGLLTDSGVFRYDRGLTQSKRLFKNSIKLLDLGADKSLLIKNIFRSKSFESVDFMQKLFARMKYKGDVLYTYFDKSEIDDKGLDEEESGYAQFIMQDIQGPKIVIVFKVFQDYIKGSIRTNDDSTNCEKIAIHFGGGGHEAAAGFKVNYESDYLKEIDNIVAIIQNII